MSTDDRFLPQGKQILAKICQVRPMPYCHLHEPSLAQQILICCDKILFSHTQRGYQFLFLDYFIIFRFSLLFYVIINFYKNYFIIIILLYFFFMKIIFIFSCSGMFPNVPCSWFYRRPSCKKWPWPELEFAWTNTGFFFVAISRIGDYTALAAF